MSEDAGPLFSLLPPGQAKAGSGYEEGIDQKSSGTDE